MEKLIKEAFIAGYEQGHNDTVESGYGCSPDKADEYYADISNQVQAGVSVKTAEVKMFPMMQSKIYITWEVAEKIYDRYVKLYGSGQTLERIAERGGFGWSEVEEIEKRFNSRFSD